MPNFRVQIIGDRGLRRYRAVEDGGRSKPSELVLKLRTGSEHMAHAVGRGPDGWLYVLVGDGTGIDRTFANSSTRAACGGKNGHDQRLFQCVVRGLYPEHRRHGPWPL